MGCLKTWMLLFRLFQSYGLKLDRLHRFWNIPVPNGKDQGLWLHQGLRRPLTHRILIRSIGPDPLMAATHRKTTSTGSAHPTFSDRLEVPHGMKAVSCKLFWPVHRFQATQNSAKAWRTMRYNCWKLNGQWQPEGWSSMMIPILKHPEAVNVNGHR